MLEVRLLGQFDVRKDGEPVDIPSRPAQSLFAYLVLNSGISHRREMLAGMFWPDSNEKNARANLRHALWRLRKSMDAFIQADNLTVAFDKAAPYHLDADRLVFEPESVPLEECFERLGVYQGELLPGFYEDWVLSERDRLEGLFNKRMQQVIERLIREERWAAVLEWAERWIARSSWPEEAFRALMRAHAALGDSGGVVTSYERLVNGLEQELGVEPSVQSQTLFENLAEGRQEAIEPSDLNVQVQPSQDIDRTVRTPLPRFLEEEQAEPEDKQLVGRKAELAELTIRLDEMLTGAGSVAFIVGEAGRGKSSLVREFARRAEQGNEELIVLTGSCDVYTGSDDPFLPFREIMSMMVGDVSSQWATGSISREQAARVWENSERAVAELVRRGPILIDSIVPRRMVRAEAPLHGQDGTSRTWERSGEARSTLAPHKNRILEEYTNVTLGLAEHSPLILVLEDLHWIDPSSSDLLLSLVKAVSLNRVLILGTYRPEEIRSHEEGRDHPLRPVLIEVKRRFGDVWLNLDSADESRDREMVNKLIDLEPNQLSGTFRQKLAEITSAHPLFVQELLDEMRERGDLVKNESGQWVQSAGLNWDILPVRVEGVIEQRIQRIDAELREALSIASVQGEVLFAEVVADVMGVDRHGLRRRFSRDLEHQHRLVVEIGTDRVGDEPVSEFRFRHILIQRYLSQQLGQGELTHLHQATALAMENLFGQRTDRVAHRLARHYSEAGLSAQAWQYLVEAGRQALRVSANQEAIDLLDRALNQQVDAGMEQGRMQADNSLAIAQAWRYSGEAYYRLGDLEQSRQRLERALEQLGERGVSRRGWLKVLLVLQALRQFVHRIVPEALIRLHRAPAAHLREQAYIYKTLAEAYLFANDIVPTAYAALRALNSAEQVGPCPELVTAYADMAPAMPLIRLRKQGEVYRRKALATAAEVGDERATAYAHLATGYYDAGEGRWQRAQDSFEHANQFHEAVGDWNRLGIGYDLMSNLAVLQGNLSQHLSWGEALFDLAERSGSMQHKTWALDTLALNALIVGGESAVENALELGQESLRLIDRHPAATERLSALSLLAEAHLRRGDMDLALRYADDTAKIMGQSPPSSFALWNTYAILPGIYLAVWEAEAEEGRPELIVKARRAARQLDLFAKAYPIGRARSELIRGRLLWIEGNSSKARTRWQNAVQRARALEMPLEEAHAHYRLGRQGSEDRAARERHLRMALSLYERLGSGYGVGLVRAAGLE